MVLCTSLDKGPYMSGDWWLNVVQFRRFVIPIACPEKKKNNNNKDSTEIRKTTRKLQLQATVKRFQFDLHLNLEGQHMLVSSWFQR